MHLLHRWDLVEVIGNIATYRCRCGRTKTRIKSWG